jgi:hypothetical protein
MNTELEGVVSIEPLQRNWIINVEGNAPHQLLGGGDHGDDVNRYRLRREIEWIKGELVVVLSRDRLHSLVQEKSPTIPTPTRLRH